MSTSISLTEILVEVREKELRIENSGLKGTHGEDSNPSFGSIGSREHYARWDLRFEARNPHLRSVVGRHHEEKNPKAKIRRGPRLVEMWTSTDKGDWSVRQGIWPGPRKGCQSAPSENQTGDEETRTKGQEVVTGGPEKAGPPFCGGNDLVRSGL